MRRIVLSGILAVWCLSLVLPAMTIPPDSVASGWEVLVNGWRAATLEVYAWYANPLFILGITVSAADWWRTAGLLSFAALVLGLTSFVVAGPVAFERHSEVLIWFQSGFYVWLVALFSLTVWCWYSIYEALQDRDRARKE